MVFSTASSLAVECQTYLPMTSRSTCSAESPGEGWFVCTMQLLKYWKVAPRMPRCSRHLVIMSDWVMRPQYSRNWLIPAVA